MKKGLLWTFGGWGQVAVGVIFCVLTVFQSWWWGVHTKPSTSAVFWVSMEALGFAAYAVIATGIGILHIEDLKKEGGNMENLEGLDNNSTIGGGR
jgi:hypothetical protein